MGGYVDDPSLANIFGNIANEWAQAPTQYLTAMSLAQKIKADKAEADRKAQGWQMGLDTGNKFEQGLQAAPDPVERENVPGPFVADPNTPNVAPPDIPSGTITTPPDPRTVAAFNAKRALVAAVGRQIAVTKPEDIQGQYAKAGVLLGGMPTDQAQLNALQFATKGDVRDVKPQPYTVVDANGRPIGQGATYDFDTNTDGAKIVRPPGSSILPSTATPAFQTVYNDKGRAQGEYDRIAQQAARGEPVDLKYAEGLQEFLYPRKGAWQTFPGNPAQFKETRETPIPDYGGPLAQMIARANGQLPPQPPQQQAPQPQQPPQPPPAPQPPGTGQPPQPPPQQQAPIVPFDPNAPRTTQIGPGNPAELRKEVIATQDNWNTVVPLFNSAVESAKHPTNQGDINLIYAFAKLMDPTTGVRDQERALVAQSGTIPQNILGEYHRIATGGGSMTPTVRLQIIDTLKTRVDGLADLKDRQERFYRSTIAPAQNVNPDEITPPAAAVTPYNRDDIIKALNQNAQPSAPRRALGAAVPSVINKADSYTGVQ